MRGLNRMSMLVAVAVALAVFAGCRNAPEGEGRDPATVQSPSEGEEAAPEGHVFDPDDQWNLAGAPVKGSETALVTIVEFSEFQCPYCSRVVPTLNQVLESEEFEGKVRVVFKHLPLPFHDRARPAAIASMAAHEQGLFWEFHDLAFANQRDLTDENFLAWAEQIGADMDQFRADLESEEIAAVVTANQELAGQLGITGTPGFLINGRTLSGAQPFEQFATVIREEIEATQALIDDGKSVSEAYASRVEANRAGAAAGNAAAQRQPERQQPQQRTVPDPEAELFVPVGQSPTLGPDDALVTIAIFSEFECPFCSRVKPTLDQVVETYGDDVRLVFKHNPLSMHQRAVPAAAASIAAQNQGKFWEFHDLAFANQRALTDENFLAWAEELGLNIERFTADMESEETAARIREDQQLAERLLAGGTPHFFINGYRLRGAQPFEAFQTIIDARLEEARALVTAGTPRAGIYEALQADAERGRAPTITEAAPQQQQRQAPPEPEGPFEIDTDGFPAMGADNGQIVMVEYSDYTCGYCRRFHNTIHEAIEGYEDRVTVVFKHYPRNNPEIAIAAEAAHRQGKFWEYSDAVFERNIRDTAGLEALAEELGLNMDNWRAVRDDPETRAFVMAQRQEGAEMGVRGTPTWFVNGNRYVGAYDTARLRSTWDQHMDD